MLYTSGRIVIVVTIKFGVAVFWRLSRKRLKINAVTHTFLDRSFRELSENVWVVALMLTVATIRVEPSVLVFLTIISKTVNINATTHTFSERSFRDLSESVWVVASMFYRFRDKRQKTATPKAQLSSWRL